MKPVQHGCLAGALLLSIANLGLSGCSIGIVPGCSVSILQVPHAGGDVQHVSNFKCDNGNSYTGPMKFLTGKWWCDGYGSMTVPSGETYSGYFKDGYFDGYGTYRYSSGDSYAGNWKAGDRHGQGKYQYASGESYDGEFRNDHIYRVTGTMVNSDGSRETGTWDRAVGRGRGSITWPDGRKYTGQWIIHPEEADPPDGDGVMSWPDDRRYSGDFRDGEPHGFGRMTHADGTAEEGLWDHGHLSRPFAPPATQPAIGG